MKSPRRPQNNLPDSVEEAAALLGASITQLTGQTIFPRQLPPKGMHSAWSTYSNLPSTELLQRMYALRSLLRATTAPLEAARSILAVLMKLVNLSSTMAASNATTSNDHSRVALTPPLLSTPLRTLWCDAVVLCYTQGPSNMETVAFVRQMLALAVLHPRSAKAAGGVRLAAVSVVAKLLEQPQEYHAIQQLAPWSLEILQTAARALKSAGQGEPSYREEAMQMASATAVACRTVYFKTHKQTIDSEQRLLLRGAMEDKAIVEAVKNVKVAAMDPFPEVRAKAAQFASRLAPMLLLAAPVTDPHMTVSLLDEVMALAVRNLDDESPHVATQWAEALARCISTAVEYNALQQQQASRSRREIGEDGPVSPAQGSKTTAGVEKAVSTTTSRFGVARKVGMTEICSSLSHAISHLVEQFVKAGGELSASRMGGTFSVGGRAVRVGWTLALVKLLQLQSVMGSISDDNPVSNKKCIELILTILGEEMEKELSAPLSSDTSTSSAANQLFGSPKGRSKGDASLVRLAVSRILREGLAEVASEQVHLSMLHNLFAMVEQIDTWNANQLQVLLIEISHVLAALGEAAASIVHEGADAITACLGFNEHGVRHEAAIACTSIAQCFPATGSKLVHTSVDDIKMQIAELIAKIASTQSKEKVQQSHSAMSMFRRSSKDSETHTTNGDPTLPQQYAIHGRSLMVSLALQDLPCSSGGLPSRLVDEAVTVAATLIELQFHDQVSKTSPGAMCMCVISGFTILSGVLKSGPTLVAQHMPLLVRAWQKACECATTGTYLQPRHDLFCMDALLGSVVVFLKYCSELLLTIPEALSNVEMLLENSLQLLLPKGRLGKLGSNPAVAGRYDRAMASLLESFAWLPSGSFPLAADDVFSFAAQKIKASIEEDIMCSLLYSIVNKEDSLLDSKTCSRGKRIGQVGAEGLEETIAVLTSEAVGHGEREAVIHLLSTSEHVCLSEVKPHHDSAILEAFALDAEVSKPPTPLHDIGSWRCPLDPSMSSKVRLIDAAIQAFAATFGLKSGQEQQEVIDMLESLVPPFLTQLAQSIGINTVLPVQDRLLKSREESSAAMNITAVLLSCLRAIPLQDSTRNNPVGLGPQWMNKAKSLLLTILPSSSTTVRRGAAEALALLVTVGVTEDAHFLQSALLHSLDEVMQGNKPDGKPRALALEPISAARSGSLLTLCCIQRTQHNITERRQIRVRDRTGSTDTLSDIAKEESLPLLQMMTRILPSATYHGVFRDYFIVRAHALHAFAVFLAYSGATDESTLEDVDLQLMRKGIELLEGNFISCWTAVSTDADKGQESEKMASEAVFLSALLRLMTIVTPHLQHFISESFDIAERFSIMGTIILERFSSHPTVLVQAMCFFEVLVKHRHLLPPPSAKVPYSENALLSCIPFAMQGKVRPSIFVEVEQLVSVRGLRASVHVIRELGRSMISMSRVGALEESFLLFSQLEIVCAARFFAKFPRLRSLAAQRELELHCTECVALENELVVAMRAMVFCDHLCKGEPDVFLRWVLLSRALLIGAPPEPKRDDDGVSMVPGTSGTSSAAISAANIRSYDDAWLVFSRCGSVRWQVKTLAAQLATAALEGSESHCCQLESTTIERGQTSQLLYHLEDILSIACLSAAAAVDQSDLVTLQCSAVMMLAKVVDVFVSTRDPVDRTVSILAQYSTQIFSAAKHPLEDPGESCTEGDALLFLAGCTVLERIFMSDLTKDSAVVRRLLRHIVPQEGVIPFFDRYSPYPRVHKSERTKLGDLQAMELIDIIKIGTMARIVSRASALSMNDPLLSVSHELILMPVELAVHSAALCLDGARILLSAKRSLTGCILAEDDGRRKLEIRSGFLFDNLDDMSLSLKHALMMGWASCGCFALKLLLAAEERLELCKEWVQDIVPLMFGGVHDVCDAIGRKSSEDTHSSVMDVDIGTACLHGLEIVIHNCSRIDFADTWDDELESMMERVWSTIVLPAISMDSNAEMISLACLLESVCSLFTQLVKSGTETVEKDSSMLLICLLKPLAMLQEGQVNFDVGQSELVISMCLDAAAYMVQKRYTKGSMVRAMFRLVLECIFQTEASDLPEKVKQSGRSLLTSCLGHESISLTEKSLLAVEVATKRRWQAWIIIVSSDATCANGSLPIVSKHLCDTSDTAAQREVLSTVRDVIQGASSSGIFLSQLLFSLGGAIFIALMQYGTLQTPLETLSHRHAACADAIKCLLVGYHHLSTQSSVEAVAAFLLPTFVCFLSVIRFNGLPNHHSPAPGSDAALGQMCTQAITSIARTSPASFKTTISNLSETERQLLEFAVRAEMSGYSVAEQAPTKKTIDLKSFKK